LICKDGPSDGSVNIKDDTGVPGEHEVIDNPFSVGSKFVGSMWVRINDSSGVLVPERRPDPEIFNGFGLGSASAILDLDFNLWPEAVGVWLSGLKGEGFPIKLFEFKELVEENGFPQGGGKARLIVLVEEA